MSKDVLFCLDEDHNFAPDNTILGTLEQVPALVHNQGSDINTKAYRLIELG